MMRYICDIRVDEIPADVDFYSNSQDIAQILKDSGIISEYLDEVLVASVFVEINEGEYTRIWTCSSEIPYNCQLCELYAQEGN